MRQNNTVTVPKGIGDFLKITLLISLFLVGSLAGLHAQNYIQLGEGNETTSNFPLYYLYNYSYSQTIYTAEELYEQGVQENAATITKILYKPNSSVSTSNWKDWVVYIGNTDKESFDDSNDWIAVGNMTEVFDGEIADEVEAGQWMEIELDPPFDWDGTSNIVIAVDQNTPDWGSSPSWAGYTSEPDQASQGL